MGQNTSHAVMAQRHEPHDSLDHFPTPPWATRALCEHVIDIRDLTVWEPACGEGYMYRALGEYAGYVIGSDVLDYVGSGDSIVHDFLFQFLPREFDQDQRIDWVITNPPFRLADQFVRRGLEIARSGVAVLVRSVFIEGVGRYNNLFSKHPPSIMAQFTERVPMVRGRVDREASTATSYCWLIWRKDCPISVPAGPITILDWIPPCRAKLEKPGDYE